MFREGNGGKLVTENIRSVLIGVCDHVKEMIADGGCDHLTAAELDTWVRLNDIDEYLSSTRAAKLLGVSLTRFYDLKKAGMLPEPVRFKGLSKPVYIKSEIEEAKKELDRMPAHELKMKILAARAAGRRERRTARD